MELELCGNQVGEVTQRFGSIEDLSARIMTELMTNHIDPKDPPNSERLDRNGKEKTHTFFITPTASSVCATNSSSFCSTSALASSLIISSSVFMPLPPAEPFIFDLAASSPNLEFSTPRRALVANIKFVLSVVLHPAKNRCWICASCAKRASPTLSDARAYFSSAAARGSSKEEGWVWVSRWEPAREARAMAWGKVFGWGLEVVGAVIAAPASAGDVAVERR